MVFSDIGAHVLDCESVGILSMEKLKGSKI